MIFSKDTKGALDLASIIVGIVAIGIIGGVIAATIFAIIPWAQDNAAKQALSAVATAEMAYRGFLSQELPDNAEIPYADKEELLSFEPESGGGEGLIEDSPTYRVYAGVTSEGKYCYSAASKSSSGIIFFSTSIQSSYFTDPEITRKCVYIAPF